MSTPPSIGELRCRLHFQIETETANARGGTDRTWQTAFRLWGSITVRSGLPYRITERLEPAPTHRIVVRYNKNINRRQRIRYLNDYFVIDEINPLWFGNKRFMSLDVSQQDVVV